jgi:hypothetical protein
MMDNRRLRQETLQANRRIGMPLKRGRQFDDELLSAVVFLRGDEELELGLGFVVHQQLCERVRPHLQGKDRSVIQRLYTSSMRCPRQLK